jgi:glucose-6-phosphate 1-epimerase
MNPKEIEALNNRFGIPGKASVVEGNGGLPKVVVATPAAAGEIYLHGAHVTGWEPRGAGPVLFLSAESRWEAGRAIRGGVPICFPWFGGKADDASAPAHGFVRTKAWELESITQHGESIAVCLFTQSSAETKRWWPADFRASLRATFASELKLELDVRNLGATPIRFEEALHTYLRVGDIQQARVEGLDGVAYVDKTDANSQKKQQGTITIVSETDRVYLNTTSALELHDPVLGRRIRAAKAHSLTTVVWNPWVAKAQALADFGDAEWKEMICLETCNVGDFAIELTPGQSHVMEAILQVAAESARR